MKYARQQQPGMVQCASAAVLRSLYLIFYTRLRPRYRSVSALALRAAGGFVSINSCLLFNHQSLSCARQGLPFDHKGLSFGHQGLTFDHLDLFTPSDTSTLE